MSFQAYIDNIRAKTGKSPEDFRKLAQEAGILKPDMKATELTGWLKSSFGLGHGHAQAIWTYFIAQGWVQTKHTKLRPR